MFGEYPTDTEFVTEAHLGHDYVLFKPARATVCARLGENGVIIDLAPELWYELDLERDQGVTPLDHSVIFDPLVYIHDYDVVGWIPMDALVLPSIDNF